MRESFSIFCFKTLLFALFIAAYTACSAAKPKVFAVFNSLFPEEPDFCEATVKTTCTVPEEVKTSQVVYLPDSDVEASFASSPAA